MKFATVFVLCVALIGISAAAPAKGPSCTKACPFDYAPVCGGPETGAEKPLSFGNACVLENYNCEKGLRWVVKSSGECPNSKGIRLS